MHRTPRPAGIPLTALLAAASLIASFSSQFVAAQILNDITDVRVGLETATVSKLGKQDRYETASDDVAIEYNGVVFSARSNAPDVQGWIRFAMEGTWTDWETMYIVRSSVDETVMGGYRGVVVRTSRFQMRFEVPADRRFLLLGAGVFDSRRDAERRSGDSGAPARPESKLGHEEGTEAAPPLITREEWNAEPFIGQPQPLSTSPYEYMTFHHAAGYSATTVSEGLAQVKAIQDLHQNVRGWSDIGYHFVIDRGGHLYQGRPFLDASTTLDDVPRLALGAHVGGFNTGNIGICLLGCYHPPEGAYCTQTITPEAYDTYVQTFAFLSESYGIPPDRIRGHRDFSSTACPGDNNYVLIPDLILDVENFVPEESPIPGELTLRQNFPNPFSDVSSIRYYLVEDGIVSLKVYDATGREVRILVNEFEEGEAWYSADFDAGSLSAGVYFYRLEFDGVGNRKSSRSGMMTVIR